MKKKLLDDGRVVIFIDLGPNFFDLFISLYCICLIMFDLYMYNYTYIYIYIYITFEHSLCDTHVFAILDFGGGAIMGL